MLEIKNLTKEYKGGLKALDNVSLSINEGEIFALLGPNGAGKTTLINAVCGVINTTSGLITVGGKNIVTDYREARKLIGLVPQELLFDIFLTTEQTVRYARGFFGKKQDDALEERILRSLSLWDKRKDKVMTLSGGMKRRTIIAKALMNEPKILFLDEPTAGVDVELRKEMWDLIRELKSNGTTIVLTTHYLEEAELLADRIGIISKGKMILAEEKDKLMKRLGQKTLLIKLASPLKSIPHALDGYHLKLSEEGNSLSFSYKAVANPGILRLLNDVKKAGLPFTDLETHEKSLEDIFVSLIK